MSQGHRVGMSQGHWTGMSQGHWVGMSHGHWAGISHGHWAGLSLRRGQRDGGVVLSRVVSFSAGAPAGGFLAPV